MSRDENVPHLFLSTTTGGSSTCSAIQGAGSDLAVHVSMCLTPNGCLILLASGSMHQNWRTACASTRKDCCHPYALMFLLCQTRPTDPWVPATHPQHASSPQGTGLRVLFLSLMGPCLCSYSERWCIRQTYIPVFQAGDRTCCTPPSVPVHLEKETWKCLNGSGIAISSLGTTASSQENAWRTVNISPVGWTLLFSSHHLWFWYALQKKPQRDVTCNSCHF